MKDDVPLIQDEIIGKENLDYIEGIRFEEDENATYVGNGDIDVNHIQII